MKPAILVVDDQEAIRLFLQATLLDEGYDVFTAASGAQAYAVLAEQRVELVLLDYMLPDTSGIEVLARIKQLYPRCEVVIVTSFSETDIAVRAMKLGARDYVSKPINIPQLLRVVEQAVSAGAAGDRGVLREDDQEQDLFSGLDGYLPSVSPAMHEIYTTIGKIAVGGGTTVLIEGESGVGKDVVARLIHANSPRRDFPFLEINCASLPEQLLESELFGHEKGAFTDASQQKMGLLELANSGTLFLDEVGEMSLTIQVKLLRVLEKMNFRRVGGLEDINVDVRIIAATNRDLAQLVKDSQFRDDLYYRLKVVFLRIPPLRERREDVARLARHFLVRFNEAFAKNFQDIDAGADAALESYGWPGNIRELRNVIESAVLLEDGPLLAAEHLRLEPVDIDRPELPALVHDALVNPWPDEGVDLLDLIGQIEEALLRKAYIAADGNQTRAASLLGLNRDKLRYRLKMYDIV